MGLSDKVKPNNTNNLKVMKLTDHELKFILTKLRSAEYRGSEFELFYKVFTKVQEELDSRGS